VLGQDWMDSNLLVVVVILLLGGSEDEDETIWLQVLAQLLNHSATITI
jgi:hypothetical protein